MVKWQSQEECLYSVMMATVTHNLNSISAQGKKTGPRGRSTAECRREVG